MQLVQYAFHNAFVSSLATNIIVRFFNWLACMLCHHTLSCMSNHFRIYSILLQTVRLSIPYNGVARGKGEIPSPKTGKNCCRKMMLFRKAQFLVIYFPDIVKNYIFLLNFHQIFTKFSQNSPTTCAYVWKRNARFATFFEKYAKIMRFGNFLKKFVDNFQKFLKISQQFVFFDQMRKNNLWFFKIFENMLK